MRGHCSDMYGHHHHHHEGFCSCGCGCDSGCGCGCGSHKGNSSVDDFFELADEAWREVLKDKIKTKIIAHKGEHIEKLAEMIAKANGSRWKSKISAKTATIKFKDELKDLFYSHE